MPVDISEPTLHELPVYRAEAFQVTLGANLGDPLSIGRDLVPGDVYGLSGNGGPELLSIAAGGAPGEFRVAGNSTIGAPGAPLFLDCVVTLMTPRGTTLEGIVIVETAPGDHTVRAVYLAAFDTSCAHADYTLVRTDTHRVRQRFAELAGASFTRGTRITMADGSQRAIEELRPGDRVLTRDGGPRPVRWIGQSTQRAEGEFAPVVIARGALNNSENLAVRPNLRLFIYQRADVLGAGQREVLVPARHLLDGRTVRRRTGGFADYFQLLLDSHHVIYAEGIAAESLFVDGRTLPLLPGNVARGLGHRDGMAGMELAPDMLGGFAEPAALLRRASA